MAGEVSELASSVGLNVGQGVFSLDFWSTLILYIVLGLAGIGILWYMWWRLGFNIRVEIHEFTNTGKVVTLDKGKLTRDRSGHILGFRLLKEKKYSGTAVDNNFFEMVVKPGILGKTVARKLHMRKDEQGNLTPVRPMLEQDRVVWKGLSNENLQLYSNIRGRLAERYNIQGFLEQYGQFLMMGGLLVTFIVAMVILFDMVGELAPGLASSSQVCAETAKQCAEAISTRQVIG